MGYIRHNAVIVTAAGYDDALQALERAHQKAQELFGPLVTPVVESVINGYRSFFVAPDGSKEDWPESDAYDAKRKEFCGFIDSLAYEDGSSGVQFVDVGYDEEDVVSVDRTNAAPLEEEG